MLDKELARRNFTPDDAKRHFAPDWLNQADTGAVGVLKLESGERVTAEIVGLNKKGDQLSLKVISSDRARNARRNHRNIPLHRIVSFELQPDLMARWPFSDPCRDVSLSNPRFIVLTTIFLCLIVGSLPLFLLLANRPWGLQTASLITYTLFEVFFTFARTGGGISGPNVPPFKFTCPAVEPQIPRLLWRHLGFRHRIVYHSNRDASGPSTSARMVEYAGQERIHASRRCFLLALFRPCMDSSPHQSIPSRPRTLGVPRGRPPSRLGKRPHWHGV